MLNDFNADSDDNKRQLYVAMTRAKRNLVIHHNGNYLDNINVDNMSRENDNSSYSTPGYLVLHLAHNDINLGYFNYIRHRILPLESGQSLSIGDEGLSDSNGEMVVKYSHSFISRKNSLEQNGYHLFESKVNFILYWKKQDEANDVKEILIILPELVFVKHNQESNHS